MNLDAVMILIRAAVKAAATGINTVRTGYIFESITGQTAYDLMVINPPSYKVPDTRNWSFREFEMKWYIVSPDKGASGDTMTDLEREVTWSSLDTYNKAIIKYMQEAATPTDFQIVGDVSVSYNSGGPGQLLPDQVLWIECTFKARVNDC